MSGKLLLYLLFGYGFIVTAVFLMQRNMLYLPEPLRLPAEQAARAGLRHWPSVEAFQGFIVQPEPANPKGTLIIFHGNAGSAHHRSYYATALARQDLRIILAEYPGYGGRSGAPSEEVLVRDALATIDQAFAHFGPPLYLWGESLGCGVAAAALRQTSVPIPGVVLFLPWDTLPDIAQTHYWYLPARWLVLDQYNSIDNLRQYRGNVAVVLAGADEVIPIRHGRRLYEAITTRKQLWVVEGTRHNEVPFSADVPWLNEAMAFICR